MKEFDFTFKSIFSGITPTLSVSKREPSLLQCHKIVPLGDNYELQETVVDINSATSLPLFGEFLSDIWQDNQGDVFQDDNNIFIDS